MERAHEENRWAELQVAVRVFIGLSSKSTGENLHVMSGGNLIVRQSQISKGSCSWLLKLLTNLSYPVKNYMSFGVTKMGSICL